MDKEQEAKLFKIGILLSILTIIFNLLEGLVSVYFGYRDETLTLFGFGVDSFIEMISAAGIFIMVKRIMNNPESHRNKFETTSLQITGVSFYLLSSGLLISVFVNIFNGYKPRTTIDDAIIALISIAVMLILVYGKQYVGKKLNSAPIIADANCTRVCIYMSIVLLISSLIYEVTGLGFMDIIGTVGIIYFSVKEGREAFEKTKGIDKCNCEQ
jgi:divalent metal cation (Fe/Co/Zn/Cd) transporter